MRFSTDGLILKEQNIAEQNRLVTVLTRDKGLMRAFVKGSNTLKNKNFTATRMLTYSRLDFFKGRESYIIDHAETIEVFFRIRQDVERLSLAGYFCELSATFAPEEDNAEPFLRLLLNSLHLLCEGKKHPLLLKAVVEMKMLSLGGYMPNLVCCTECACYEADEMLLLPQEGMLICRSCGKGRLTEAVLLPKGVLTALRHIIYSDFEKIFSFELPEGGIRLLSAAAERYLLLHTDKKLQTLEFYHALTEGA